jgi:hypothetical protein
LRIDSRLHQQMAYVRDRFGEGAPGATSLEMTIAGGDPDRARVIRKKIQTKRFFPVSFYEVFRPGADQTPGIAQVTSYVKYLRDHGVPTPPVTPVNPPPQPWESAACLYMILRHGPETAGEDDLGIGGSVRHFRVQPNNPNNLNTIPVLVDAWGSPLIFCRWATGDPNTGISGVDPLGYNRPAGSLNDPFDPKGYLSSQTYLGDNALRAAFQSRLHVLPPVNPVNHARKSLRLYPVVASAGPDKLPGFVGVDLLTLKITNPADAEDNIYSTDSR